MKRATKKAQAAFDAEMEAMARRAWRERGIVILWPDKIKDARARECVVRVAQDTHGARPRKAVRS